MLWAAALVACAVTHLALAAPANVTASAAAPASAPQPLLSGHGAAVPAAGPAAARQAAQTVNASGVPYNLSAPAQGPAPGADPASYARRRTVNVSNGTHILYNVSVVTADGSPAPPAAAPFAPDQTLYTVSATPPPAAPASNTPLITWVTIAGGVVGAALLASSVLLLTDLWNGRLLCLCCRQHRRPPPPEPRPSARDGPRELRLPVLVVNPGKDVVVAQRVSMDRANTGAQLPVVDDYVFHKTSSNADQAGMSAMVEAQLEQWRSQATTASGCLPETLTPRPSRPLPASPPLSRANTLSPHPSTRLPRGAGAEPLPSAPSGLGQGDPLRGPAHACAASAAGASGCSAADAATSSSEMVQIVVHPAGGQGRDGACSAPGRAADAPAEPEQAAPASAWGRSAGQRAPPRPPPQRAACSGSARSGAGAAGAGWAAGQAGGAQGDRAGGPRTPCGAGVAAGAGAEGGAAASPPGAARPWPVRVAVSPFALDALQLQRRASE